jgi:UDP-N-acetylmuramate: L-alanyl-gamma-D-glutamyl-meso-diaminopimelate ligase
MATLAAMLKSRGHDVRGSDQHVYPPMSDFLVEQEITTLQGYTAKHITGDLDLVIVDNAISRENAELEEVLDRGFGTARCPKPSAIISFGAPVRWLSPARTASPLRRRWRDGC